ncbi:MAG: glycoside hydrolase family 78 protein [Armatimonadetes bacterium]|nr:glycoside hydrolase family 78 protein [Armatimonadota bacterium]
MIPILALLALEKAPMHLTPIDLRCEYRRNPLGVEDPQPRLSFRLEASPADSRDRRQTAYRIVVASSEAKLVRGEFDLWDTGKVPSAETSHIAYGGRPLGMGERAFWKAKVWDEADREGPWSRAAFWGAGLLSPENAKAKWIGLDTKPAPDPEEDDLAALKGARWIGFGDMMNAAAGRYGFRRTFVAEGDCHGYLYLAADDAFRVYLDGQFVRLGDSHKAVTKVDLGTIAGGFHTLAVEVANYSKGPSALVAILALRSPSGLKTVATNAEWKAADRLAEGWFLPAHDDSRWAAATEGPAAGENPWYGLTPVPFHRIGPPVHLRKEFTLPKRVARATAFVSALGAYRVWINGRRIHDDELMPGYVDYRKRAYALAYDVTPFLREGPNAIGAILAEGWYGSYLCFTGKDRWFGGVPKLFVQVEIEYDDGSKDRLVTDGSWKASTGPMQYADLLMGTRTDTRVDLSDWTRWGYDDRSWRAPEVADSPGVPVFRCHPGEPIRRQERITAKECWESAPGVWTFDLGQNMVGWVQLRVQGEPGQVVRLRHAEMLNPDRTVYTTNLRAARAIDEFVLAGGPQTLEPAFTFHGFRYVEVAGLTHRPKPTDVVGVVLNSDLDTTGRFQCSHPLVNQLVHNILWGQKGNYLDVPTDCPQRDERAGWTGDAQFFMGTAAYMMDVAPFFSKWLEDLVTDGQDAEGAFPDIAPNLNLGTGNVAWGDAALVCTERIHRVYGDRRVLERYLPAFERYAEYMAQRSEDGVRGYGAYGDWLNLGGGAKAEVIGTAYHAQMLRLIAQMHAELGHQEQARQWAERADHVKRRFQELFVAEDGSILESSQTGYALAFAFDLVPDDRRAKAAAKFREEMAKHGFKNATGFIGTPILLPALQKAGLADVAQRVLLQEEFPSWLLPVKLGATTIWERWDGWLPDRGFQDPGMNSFNHYAFGSVGQFLFESVAGIRPAEPGFRRVRIEPLPVRGLTWVEASYESIHGPIGVSWRKRGKRLQLSVTVPPNVQAEIPIPADASTVRLDGKPLPAGTGSTLSLGSGAYRLDLPLVEP